MKVQDDNPITRLPPAPLMLGVVAACIISIGLVWLVGQQSVVALAYGGALIAILLMLLLAARLKTDPAETQMLQPDWSVTSAAIETRHRAIAIVDRANRLVCANSTYEGWFDGISAPYELAMDAASREAASEAARSAWRDGRAEVPVVRLSSGDMEYRLRIERSGRGEAYLVWRFDEIRTQRSYDGLSERLAGPLGEVLSRAGVEVALVAPDGIVQTTTPGLAERATGHRENAVGGLEFVQLLRSDDRDRIFFAREGQQGSPQTLIHVPLDIPNASKMSDADETPSIMLLLDSTVGIGGGWESTGKAAIPQLEALLSALPLGLALTDRDGR
ncbi:MAG TPA: hybrid sensor histidine kinase/response regulator, partial [Erythrobacter sp.]|nr:hybrid sensor histidine kinase/response regulator [Erythrobacter sp.]